MKSTTRKTRYARLALAGLVLLTTCGCSAVYSKRPVGEKPAKIAAKDWEGNWVASDGGSLKVKVVDADKGILRLFWVDDDDKGNQVMKTTDVELRESGEWLFASTKAEDKGQTKGYAWGRIKNEDRQIILWFPADKIFKGLVKDGVFPGKIDGDEVLLEELKPQHLKIITSGERGVLFEWDRPAVFVKVGN